MATRRLAELGTVIMALALAPTALAQDFDISWHTIDGGGEMFTGGGDSPACDPCDMNCDETVNALDIEPFLDLLFDPNAQPCAACSGDVNGDGSIDALDIEPFLNCLFP